jgi:hypothetical protein
MTKTIRMYSKKGTRKNRSGLQKFEREVVVKFLEVLNLIKLYHWKTHNYATHKATDELSSKLHDNVDSFVEVLLGKRGDRVNLLGVKHISLNDFSSVGEFKREIERFKGYLVGLNNNAALKSMSNSDLYNIRDEMLANVNQFLYLLTFK